jgi:hypothetical protein
LFASARRTVDARTDSESVVVGRELDAITYTRSLLDELMLSS